MSSDVPAGDHRPEVIPSEVDPDVECVRTDLADAGATAPPPDVSGPPPSSASPAVRDRRLCPEGYTPRWRRHRDHVLDGKRIVADSPPFHNPEPPPGPGEPSDGQAS